MSNFQIASDAIRSMTTGEELDDIIEVLRSHRTFLSRKAVRSLSIGNTVSFDNGKGSRIKGTVIKVNQKNVKVRCNQTQSTWRVAASFLIQEVA